MFEGMVYFADKEGAEKALAVLRDLFKTQDWVLVSDAYFLLGLKNITYETSTHGWTDLSEAKIHPTPQNDWYIEFPPVRRVVPKNSVDFELGPSWDPEIKLFAHPSVENSARMLSIDRDVWVKMGEPKKLRVTIDILPSEE